MRMRRLSAGDVEAERPWLTAIAGGSVADGRQALVTPALAAQRPEVDVTEPVQALGAPAERSVDRWVCVRAAWMTREARRPRCRRSAPEPTSSSESRTKPLEDA